MKKIILSISLIIAFNMSNAQSQRINSEKIDAYKKIYLTEKLNLDQKNESKFWEVYDIYQENLKDNYRKRRLKYRTINLDSSNFSDEEYEQFINDFLDYEKKN